MFLPSSRLLPSSWRLFSASRRQLLQLSLRPPVLPFRRRLRPALPRFRGRLLPALLRSRPRLALRRLFLPARLPFLRSLPLFRLLLLQSSFLAFSYFNLFCFDFFFTNQRVNA